MYKFYEDTSFVTGDSPATHSVEADLGKKGIEGYIHNSGSGQLTFALSYDGTTYGDEVRLNPGEKHSFNRITNTMTSPLIQISKIRVTWIANTSYKIYIN